MKITTIFFFSALNNEKSSKTVFIESKFWQIPSIIENSQISNICCWLAEQAIECGWLKLSPLQHRCFVIQSIGKFSSFDRISTSAYGELMLEASAKKTILDSKFIQCKWKYDFTFWEIESKTVEIYIQIWSRFYSFAKFVIEVIAIFI